MKVNDIITIIAGNENIPEAIIGKSGFIEEDAGFINGSHNYVVVIVDNDGTPIGNGPVPESCLKLTDDKMAIDAVNLFNDKLKNIIDNTKSKVVDINAGLNELSKKYNIPADKIREIYTDVYKLTKGILDS
jgi:hypothetical protein